MENVENINEQFDLGKRMLDSGRYLRAIEIYNDLIPQVEDYEDDPAAKVTLETALNNRACAKCKQAILTKELGLYESGVDDFKKAVKVSGVTDKYELSILTSWRNLQFAIDEMTNIQLASGENLRHTDMGSAN